MKHTIKDENGVEWTYDTKQHRLYVTEADDEFIRNGDDPLQNGYDADPEELLEFLIGEGEVAGFDPLFAFTFIKDCQLSAAHNR